MATLRPLSLYDPRQPPKLACATDRLTIGPGLYSAITNWRSDIGALIARLPDATVIGTPPSGARTSGGAYFPMGSWQGFANGIAYFLSAWQMTAGGTAIFSQNLTTGAFAEVTDPGGASATTWGGSTAGLTRFTTQNAKVSFSVQSRPRRVVGGTAIQSIDVIQIQNGEDQPIIYSPGANLAAAAQVMWNTPIVIPAFNDTFHTLASLSSFWQVRGNTKTYAVAGVVNLANHFKMTDSAVIYGVSDATLRVVLLTLGTAATTNDIATVQFPVSGVTNQESFRGKWLYTFWNASQSTLTQILKDTKIELGKENAAYASVTTWTTIFDPTSSDPSYSQLPDFLPLDTGGSNFCLAFTLQNISALATRTAYHIRLTRVNTTAPTAAITAYLLAAGSTGSGGGFPFGTEWTEVLHDIYTDAESPPFVSTRTDVDMLYTVGGPRGPDVNSTTPMLLPRLTQMWYDYRMKIKLPDSTTAINGGLQGQPSHASFYFRDPATEDTPYFWSQWEMWNPSSVGSPHQWSINGSGAAGATETLRTEQRQIAGTSPDGFGYGTFGQVDYAQRDPGIPAPNDFNQSIPKAAVIQGAMGRNFVGNTRYSNGYSRQEIRYSDLGFYSRFRSVPDINDPNSGGRLTVDGETIKAFKTCAAAADAAVTIYFWTDKSFNALATAGGNTYAGSGFSGFELGQRNRISSDGTNEPGSIIERNGVLAWINNDGHFVMTAGGMPQNISLGYVTNSQGLSNSQVADIVADIPSARRGHVEGVYARHRMMWFMTPAAGTTNTRCAIFDIDRDLWESLDTLTSGERVAIVFDSAQNGAGVRVILHGADGKTYGYEEGSGTVATRLTTRAFTASELGIGAHGYGYTIDEIELTGDADSGNSLNVDVYANASASAYRFGLDLGAQTTLLWIVEHDVASGSVVSGWSAYFDIQATVSGGKSLRGLLGYPKVDESDQRGRG